MKEAPQQEVDMQAFLALCQRVTDLEKTVGLLKDREFSRRYQEQADKQEMLKAEPKTDLADEFSPFHDPAAGCASDCACGCSICNCRTGTMGEVFIPSV